jgi:hypothetical protein
MRSTPFSGLLRVTRRFPAACSASPNQPRRVQAGLVRPNMGRARIATAIALLLCLGSAPAASAPAASAAASQVKEELEPSDAPVPQAPVAPPPIEIEAPIPATVTPTVPDSARPLADDSAKAASVPAAPVPVVPGEPAAAPAEPAAAVAESPGAPDAEDVTIEVDPGQSRNKDKSLPLAMLFSATLPGSGEFYLNEKGNAKAFLLTEAGFWASLYVAFVVRESYLSSARNYASEHAGIDASSKSPAFLETMATYRAYQEKQHRQDSYELAQILSGKRDGNYDIKAEEANYWDFGSSVNPENTANWRTFQQTLRYYRASKVAISFAIGALALNRLASLANTLRVYKGTSAKGLGLIEIIPEIGSDNTGARVSLGF